MPMTSTQVHITVLCVALGAVLTRFAPFILFPARRPPPAFLRRLEKGLPAAAAGLLLVYCLKDVSLTVPPRGIPELLALACVAVLHLWRKNALLSIAGGTALYMFLIQRVF